MTMKIPMLDLQREYEFMKKDIDNAIQRCLNHQKWIFGPEIEEFERAVSEYLNVSNCIGVSSGTEALVLSLRALAIKLKGQEFFEEGDEFLTTPFTFTATGDSVLRSGATPVFIDIDPQTFNIDPAKIREYLHENAAHVRGIIPVHLYGRPCNMSELTKIAEEFDIAIIEDVAQAFGASWNGQKLGSGGKTGAFSFFPSKNLGCFGDGGMISTSDGKLAEIIRMLLKHGGKDKYNVDHIGYNARLDTLQAAILLAKIKYIDTFNKRRVGIASKYRDGLSGIKNLILPLSDSPGEREGNRASEEHVFHQYTVRTTERASLQDHLNKNGISTMVYYPFPLHKMKVFKNRMRTSGDLIHAERAAEEVLSLPIEPLQEDDKTAYIIQKIREYFKDK